MTEPRNAAQTRDSRLAELRDAARRLRTARRSWSDKVLLVAGGVLIPLGIVLIIIGWYGSAQTTLDFEQTPYLISGGLLGLALVVLGAALYFGYWITYLVRHHQRVAARDEAHQKRLEALMIEIATSLRGSAQPGSGGAGPRPDDLVVTAGGTMLHRADCVATQGQRVSKPRSRAGLELCGLCRPAPAAPKPRSKATT